MFRSIIQSLGSSRRLAGGALILALTQFGASLAGLIRDRVLASTFPVGADQLDVVSVYIAAFRPSDLLIQMFILSGFVAVLTPLLASHLAHNRKEQMDNLLSSVIVIASVFFGIIALILAVNFESLAPLFTEFTGEKLELYIQFGRLAIISNFLFVIGYAFGQYEVTQRWFWWYGISPIVYTLGTIAGALWLTPVVGPFGPMYGTVIGAALYTILRVFDCVMRRDGFRLRIKPLWHPELLLMASLMLPPMLARGAGQLELLMFDRIGSGLALGSVTINAYARNFQAAAVGVVGIAFAQSAYSLLAQAIAKGEIKRFWSYLKKGSFLTFGVAILAMIVLIILCKFAAWLVHLTEPSIESIFIVTLTIYALSIPFECLNHLLLRASYATKHTAIPASLTVINGVIAIAIAWIYAPMYGVYALAGGFFVGQAVQMVGLWVFLRIRIKSH
jgi:peptidoglycan biosynthesis protein MviN/MurJ (putative lipid II flippase)